MLGLVNYVGKFIPNLSEMTAPMRELLVKNVTWNWGNDQEKAFQKIKEVIVSKRCLAYYDVSKPVRMQVDASRSGIGAVLLQEGKPVAYASKSLTPTQQRYAIIEQEMLAVVFGCQRFHQYIYGKKVQIESDHKPLESIMKKALQNTPPRLQRMLLVLQKYDMDLKYLAGKENILADTLSRASLEETTEDIAEEELEAQVHMVYANAPATNEKMKEIQEETAQDSCLMNVARYVTVGWPTSRDQVPADVKPYWSYKEELSMINGILFKGERMIIPAQMRKNILKQLHQAHMGIEKTKWRARATIFWPHINQQIEEMVKTCTTCLHNQRKQSPEPLMLSDIPHYPFQMVGTDLFHWNGQDFILMVDYNSRYWEIEKLRKTDAVTVIKKIKKMFSRIGIPEVVRSDNGPQYNSREFKKFAKEWGFKQITSSPEYSRSNGLAEKTLQTVKALLEKAKEDKKDPHLSILEARNTPVDNYKSPAELVCGRQLRSIIPVSPSNLTWWPSG